MIQTEDDSVGVENTLVYYAALRTAKVPARPSFTPPEAMATDLRASDKAVTGWPKLADSGYAHWAQ
jgi:hypothetical protein